MADPNELIDESHEQRTIEKSGYKSKHSMLHFKVK